MKTTINFFFSMTLSLLSLSSCQNANNELEQTPGKKVLDASSKSELLAITDIPQSLKARNLTFNVLEYNQFFSDLKNNPEQTNALFSDTAEEALTYTSTPFAQLSKGDGGEKQAGSDGTKLKALALKFIATNNAKYRDKAIEILVSWAKINRQTSHRPLESVFLEFYEAYSMLRSNTNDSDKAIIDGWIRKRATSGAYNFSLQSSDTLNKINNWEAIRILFLFYSGYILQDSDMINNAYSAYTTFLDKFLLPGGQTKDFKDRDAFAYLAYGMQFVSRIVNAVYHYEGASASNNLFNQKNSSGFALNDVITFWSPYLLKEKTYVDFKRSVFSSEREKAAPYSPESSLYALDRLIHQDVNTIYPYIKFLRTGDQSRFANITIYLNTLKNPNSFL